VLATTAPCAMLYVPAAMKVFTPCRLAEEVRPWVVTHEPLPLSKVVDGEPPEVRNSLPSGMVNVAVVASPKVTVTTWPVTSTSAPAAGGVDTKSSPVTTVEMINDVAVPLGAVKGVPQVSTSEAAGGLPVPGHVRGCRGGGGEAERGGGGDLGGGGEWGGGGEAWPGGGGCAPGVGVGVGVSGGGG